MPLSPKQSRFVSEFLIDLNGKAAAIRAGYSEKSAIQIASNLLAKAEVKAAVAAGRAKVAAKLEVTAEAVVAELAKLGFANMSDYMRVGEDGAPRLDFAGLTRDQMAALSEVTVEEVVTNEGPGEAQSADWLGEGEAPKSDPEEVEQFRAVRKVKFKLWDKRAALVDLGRHLGIFEADKKLTIATDETIAGLLERIAANGRRIQDRG